MANSSTPSAFGRYRVVHQVGAGVLGPVFRGYDPEQDRVVAIKAFLLDLTPEQAHDLATDLGRLVALKIPHPFIIIPFGAGADGSTAYLVEEYFVAESADVALKQYGPAPVPDAMRLIGQLAGALDAASAAGVYHGALHPRDVLVAPHEVRLTGLGVVPALERVGFRPQARRPYMAPERVVGGTIGAASDVFSLACLAFELVTGRRPTPSGDGVTVDTSIIQAADTAALSEVFARVLSARPEDRYLTALGFAAALKHALTGEPLQAGAEAQPPRSRRAGRAAPRTPPLPLEPEPPVPPPGDAPPARPDDLPLAPPLGARSQPDMAAALRRWEVDVAPGSTPLPSFLDAYQGIVPGGSEERTDALEVAPEAEPPAEAPVRKLPVAPAVEPAPVAAPAPLVESATAPMVEPVPMAEPASVVEPLTVVEPLPVAEPAPVVEPAAVVEPVAAPAEEPAPVAEPAISAPPTAAPEAEQRERTLFSEFSGTPPPGPVEGPPRRSLVSLLGMLLVGLALGFPAGYFMAPRASRLPVPAAAATTPSPQGQPANAAGGPAAGAPAPPAPASTAVSPPEKTARQTARERRLARAQAKRNAAGTTSSAQVGSVEEGSLVVVSSPPGARVLVDGHAVGKTPLTLRTVKPGSHKVKLELTGYHAWESDVPVTAGRQKKVTASLERRPGG